MARRLRHRLEEERARAARRGIRIGAIGKRVEVYAHERLGAFASRLNRSRAERHVGLHGADRDLVDLPKGAAQLTFDEEAIRPGMIPMIFIL